MRFQLERFNDPDFKTAMGNLLIGKEGMDKKFIIDKVSINGDIPLDKSFNKGDIIFKISHKFTDGITIDRVNFLFKDGTIETISLNPTSYNKNDIIDLTIRVSF